MFTCLFFSSSHVSFQGSTWCYRLVLEFWLLHEGGTSVLLKTVQISTLVGLIIPFPQVPLVLVFIFILYLGVGFKYFSILTPKIGEDSPKLTFAYFFRWVGSPTNQIFFGKIHMIVSLNGATPNLHPKMISFSRKTHGFVGETHHLRKPPYSHAIIKSSAALFLKQILIFHLFDPVTRKGRWFHQVTLERVEVLSHNVLHELEEVMKESNLPWWKRMEKGKSRN